jgi:subtilisin-like proprotein convertase family protein
LDIAEAMTWKMGDVHILSNSWGYRAFAKDDDDFFAGWYPLRQTGALTEAALNYAVNYGRGGRGTIITFSAGNDHEFKLDGGNGTIVTEKSGARMDFSPLKSSLYTIAVGAVGSLGLKAFYSQIGSSLLISAPSLGAPPSLGIMTTDNKGRYGDNPGFGQNDFAGSGDVTKNFSGTSAACPVVSGVIALMLEKKPNLGWRDVQEILIRSANNTFDAAGWETNGAGIKFNYNYGAGLVYAAAAVALSGNWTNLSQQKSQTVTTNATTPIDATGNANATITRTFTVTGTNLRAEHATLELTVTDIPKGDLTITLRSPSGSNSTFCEPHSDTTNFFTNWKFMTVRNWAESSNGTWTLTVTNNGATTGNLTDATLIVYGTAMPAATSSVTLAASTTLAPLSSNITLNATASVLNANGTISGNITGVQFFRTFNGTTTLIGNGTRTGNATNPATYSIAWNTSNLTAGNYSITANATSSGNVTGISNALTVKLDPILIAGWDFQTLTSNKSSVPLATALMSVRTYNANFGNGNGALLLNGSNGSSQWSYANGEIFVGPGSTLNAAAGFSPLTSNPAALLLRAGRNLSANGKSLIFRCNSTANKTYTISYTANSTTGGFTTHAWSWSNNATGNYTTLGNATLTSNFTTSTFTTSTATATANGTLFLRLTPSGATSASGTNLIDNIQIQSN